MAGGSNRLLNVGVGIVSARAVSLGVQSLKGRGRQRTKDRGTHGTEDKMNTEDRRLHWTEHGEEGTEDLCSQRVEAGIQRAEHKLERHTMDRGRITEDRRGQSTEYIGIHRAHDKRETEGR